MRLPHIIDASRLDVALVGVPFDCGTSYRPGPRFGPRNIRVQSAMIRPYNPVLEVSPFDCLRIGDYGDVSVNPLSIEETYRRIQQGLKTILDAETIPLCVGGDHSILLPRDPCQAWARGSRAARRSLRYLGSILGIEVFARHACATRHRGRAARRTTHFASGAARAALRSLRHGLRAGTQNPRDHFGRVA